MEHVSSELEFVSTHALRGSKTALLTTYRRTGRPIATPVSVAFDGERVFFRTWNTAGKAKRLRGNPNVEVAPCTFRGTVTGPTFEAQAKLLLDVDAQFAARALAERHPLLQRFAVPFAHRLMRVRTLHYELLARD
jgi:PPOX class probable F420-dependent enzyme